MKGVLYYHKAPNTMNGDSEGRNSIPNFGATKTEEYTASFNESLLDGLIDSKHGIALQTQPSLNSDQSSAKQTTEALSGSCTNVTTVQQTPSAATSLPLYSQLYPQFSGSASQILLTSKSLQSLQGLQFAQPTQQGQIVQQFLIPASNVGGTPQLLTVPLSLSNQGNQTVQFITANGQLLQVPNLHNLLATTQVIVPQATASAQPSTETSPQKNTTQLLLNQAGSPVLTVPALLGQTVLTAPQLLQTIQRQQQQQTVLTTDMKQQNQLPFVSNYPAQLLQHIQQLQNASVDSSSQQSPFDDDKSSNSDDAPTIASTLASLPKDSRTIGTTIDGINLDEIKEFAKLFKLRRLALGLTQTQVGQALSAAKGPAYSQSAICRFEKLDITPKSAAKIKPVLEKWMQEAEQKYADRLKQGSQNYAELVGDMNSKKRKRRTSFTPQALDILNSAFEKNTHPSGSEMTTLAQSLHYDREVIRVWFCNKRQALKNSYKKLKQTTGDTMYGQNNLLKEPPQSFDQLTAAIGTLGALDNEEAPDVKPNILQHQFLAAAASSMQSPQLSFGSGAPENSAGNSITLPMSRQQNDFMNAYQNLNVSTSTPNDSVNNFTSGS